jgi:hypothetical protein
MFVLNWINRSRLFVTGALANSFELQAVVLLERLRQRHKILRVHLQRVGMAWVTHQLIAAVAGNFSGDRSGPVAFNSFADRDDGTAVVRVHFVHGFQRRGQRRRNRCRSPA